MIRAVTTALLLVALLTGCGVPSQDSAVVAPREEVPFGLLDADREPVAGARPSRGATVEVFLHSDDEERLVAVERRVARSSVQAALAELEEPPTSTEKLAGLNSTLSDIDGISSVDVAGVVVEVDLTDDFADIGGSDQLVALAQIVYTATGRPGADQVTFTLEGEPVEIPIGDGTLTTGTVDREDYEQLQPRR